LKRPTENTVPLIDLSIETLTRVTKGDVSKLPQFVVHRNRTWKKNTVRLDKKNRIHMNVRTFVRQVKSQLPVRAGIWLGPNEQIFHLDLHTHHLQGGEETVNRDHNYKHSRELAGADEYGRFEDDDGHGETIPGADANGVDQSDLDAARAENRRSGGGVRRDWLGRGDTEDR
jgi:hypothetical protein